MLFDLVWCDYLDFVVFCYFNVCGVSFDGDIGEEYDLEIYFIFNVLKVVVGLGGKMKLFGIDYLICDGICICDYIYVVDLVDVYLCVFDYLMVGCGSFFCNVGMGDGFIVCEVFDVVVCVMGCFVFYEEYFWCVGDLFVFLVNIVCVKLLFGFELQYFFIDEIVVDVW